jgi:putative DNA primase/helicase
LFVFNLNKDPSLSGDQVAIETRFHVFRFTRTFMATPTEPSHLQADPRLKDDMEFIRNQICPAFLNWLLAGLVAAINDGIDYSTGRQAMEDVRRESCHLWEFCDAVGLLEDEGGSVTVGRVWEVLQRWYQEEGYLDDRGRWLIDPPNDRTVKAPRLLVAALRTVFPKLASARVGKTRSHSLTGIRLESW